MKITIESPSIGEEDEIIVRCHNLDDKIMNLLYALKNETVPIIGYADSKIISKRYLLFWIVNTFSDNFFKGMFFKFFWC